MAMFTHIMAVVLFLKHTFKALLVQLNKAGSALLPYPLTIIKIVLLLQQIALTSQSGIVLLFNTQAKSSVA